MSERDHPQLLRLTCPPCGEVLSAAGEEALIATAIEHARKFHDLDLLASFSTAGLAELIRRENDAYWSQVGHLLSREPPRTVLDEKLCEREREIVSYVAHGFANREIAARLCISERTVSTHLVNIYDKLNVHSRAELTGLVRAADRIVEAALRQPTAEFGPFVHTNGPKTR